MNWLLQLLGGDSVGTASKQAAANLTGDLSGLLQSLGGPGMMSPGFSQGQTTNPELAQKQLGALSGMFKTKKMSSGIGPNMVDDNGLSALFQNLA